MFYHPMGALSSTPSLGSKLWKFPHLLNIKISTDDEIGISKDISKNKT